MRKDRRLLQFEQPLQPPKQVMVWGVVRVQPNGALSRLLSIPWLAPVGTDQLLVG